MTLLAQLAVTHPQAVRVLLLDQDQDSGLMQGLDCAHRLLSRPLDAVKSHALLKGQAAIAA